MSQPILKWRMEQEQSCTLEQFLRTEKNVSRRLLTKLKRTNGLWCNGTPIRSIDLVQFGDVIELRLPEVPSVVANAVRSVPVCLETADFVVYDKPPDLPVHPSQNHYTDTLGNCFCAAYPGLACRPVNRLDRNTSGLCVFAKSAYAANQLQYRLQKRYYAVVEGVLTGSGTVSAPIAREQESIIIRCVRADGKPAVTHYRALRHNDKYTLLQLRLETGRTHQIRVHMAHIGHPLAGDTLYGGRTDAIDRQALHCGRLILPLGQQTGMVTVGAALPEDMASLLETGQHPDFQ